uniref:Switch-associated protein 70 n=1 Tax=Sarcophilus harrisii TaxID=9305 RepID=A0A7N4NHK3_SARHA
MRAARARARRGLRSRLLRAGPSSGLGNSTETPPPAPPRAPASPQSEGAGRGESQVTGRAGARASRRAAAEAAAELPGARRRRPRLRGCSWVARGLGAHGHGHAMGGLKEELLKAIWHAFTALDLDRSGKVSKSQLKVLSHNLCTVLKVPHDPVALEEHFRDDDEGPVSNQGYMPYLNKFILEKIEYLLKKLTEAMGGVWQQEEFEHYKINFDATRDGLSAWELIELIGSGQFSKGMDWQTVSMAVNEVFNELILDVLKQGYMMKKGHRRKNWTERWFVLKPNIISYYVSEDLKDKKGDIILDDSCCVESLPDKDGKKCLFLIKCLDKTFEISASDKKKKQEWIQAIHSTLHLLKLGSPPPHKEARQRRKELRKKMLAEQEELERQMKELQVANETKQQELEQVRKKLEEAASRAAEEEKKRLQTQVELQDRFSLELEREKLIRQQMEEQVAQKSSELEQYLQRVRELEDMYLQLQEALEDERQARQDEETVRKLQARLLEEETSKRAELERWHMEQQQAIQTTEAEKQELENQRLLKERALQEAMQQLEQLEQERKQALEQYEGVKKKLEMAARKTRSWKDKVAQHEGLIRLIEPGSKNPHLITNWGPAAFTQAELEEREKSWKGKKSTE